ncbi:MAG: cytochrome c biogenesis protein ResB [Micrococcales bacterium]|nr:cytochrome c biogenesis protein ResB [Micrococcales bacterium]
MTDLEAGTEPATEPGADEATDGLDVTPASPAGPAEAAPEVAPSEFFRKIYQFFYSKTLGVVLILALAVYILVGAVVTQAPGGTYDNPDAKALFLDQMTAKYGRIASLFDSLGLFHLFSSIGFLVLIGLLALSIVACTTHRLPNLWRRARHPLTHATDRLFTQARYHAQLQAPGGSDALDQVKEVLKQKRLRVKDDPHNQDAIYADRFAWGPFGTVAAHLSFLIIIAAFIVSSMTALNIRLSLPVGGDPVELGHGSGLTVQAVSFEASFNDDGRPLDYVSEVIVRRGEKVIGDQEVRVNQPLTAGGYRFHQSDFGLGVQVQVTGKDGEMLFDQVVEQPGTTDDGSAQAGGFELEDPSLEVVVFTPASGRTDSGIEPGNAVIRINRPGDSQELAMEEVAPGEPLVVGNYSFTFVREAQSTGITVRKDPGALLMWIGSILLVGGMTVTFTCRHRRYWLRLTKAPVSPGPSGDIGQEEKPPSAPGKRVLQVASTDRQDGSFQRHFDNLVADLATTMPKAKGDPHG